MFTPVQINQRQIKSYQTDPERVEAVLLTDENLDEAARWCGGVRNDDPKPSDPMDIFPSIKVPSVAGNFNVCVGEYLVRDVETGRFTGRNKQAFEARFHEVGLRQDGIALPTTVSGGRVARDIGPMINTTKSGEAYGPYGDPRYAENPSFAPRDALDMS